VNRRTATTAIAMTIALTIGGCAAAPAAPPATPTAPSAAAPSPTPTPAPAPTPTQTSTDPRADWQEIATPNGTATFSIPPGWTAEVGGEEIAYDGEQHWVNSVTVRNETGTMSAGYYDGPYDDVGAAADFGVVRSTPVATLDAAELEAAGDTDSAHLEHHASAWWTSGDGATFTAYAGLARLSRADSRPVSPVGDGQRTVSFGVREDFASEADAVAWLESDDVAAVLEIVATLDLTGIPAPVLP
jgi:hypothetical protein